jgi:hypothetical protein
MFYQSNWTVRNILIMYVAWKQIMQVVDVKLNPGFLWQKILFTSQLDLNLRKKLQKWYIWCKALYGTENDTLRKINQKYLESYEMWCWWRIGAISCTDRVKRKSKYCVEPRKKETFCRKYKLQRWRAKWIGHVVRRNCLLKLIIEGKIELTGRRWRRLKQLLDNLQEKRRY